jgi:hypothetical protein
MNRIVVLMACWLIVSGADAALEENLNVIAREKSDELLTDWLQQDLKNPYATDLLNSPEGVTHLKGAIDVALAETRTRVGGTWIDAKVPEGQEMKPLLDFYRQLSLARRAARLKPLVEGMPKLVYARHAVMGVLRPEANCASPRRPPTDSGGKPFFWKQRRELSVMSMWTMTERRFSSHGKSQTVGMTFTSMNVRWTRQARRLPRCVNSQRVLVLQIMKAVICPMVRLSSTPRAVCRLSIAGGQR